MRMLSSAEQDLAVAAIALKEGKLVAFPTETVYGLGADVFNPAALARVFEAKRRPTFDPLIVHIAELGSLDTVADLASLDAVAAEKARRLAERLWPGPLTLILPKKARVPDLATSGLPTVAVRFPDHPVARRLIELSTGAIAAPSANPFGYLSPTRAEHVASQLGERVDFIVDGGRCDVGVESTVLDLSAGEPTILRPGGMPAERIVAEIGSVSVLDRSVASPKSPGQLPSHYAPHVPLKLYPRGALSDVEARPGEALLFFDAASRDAFLRNAGVSTAGGAASRDAFLRNAGVSTAGGAASRDAFLRNAGASEAGGAASRDAFLRNAGVSTAGALIRVLSERGDAVEAAANLFDLLHELDTIGVSVIRAERADSGGLGAAINDRLYKASRKSD